MENIKYSQWIKERQEELSKEGFYKKLFEDNKNANDDD